MKNYKVFTASVETMKPGMKVYRSFLPVADKATDAEVLVVLVNEIGFFFIDNQKSLSGSDVIFISYKLANKHKWYI